jgi:hypothetical protein
VIPCARVIQGSPTFTLTGEILTFSMSCAVILYLFVLGKNLKRNRNNNEDASEEKNHPVA